MPVTLSENEYKAVCFAFYSNLEITVREAEGIRSVKAAGGKCPIPTKEFKRLEKLGYVENRGFGFRTSIAGEIQLSIFDGVDPWYGGPVLSYEKAIAAGLVCRK